MFSSRMFAALALVAAVAAYPADNPFIPHPITTITEADFEDGPSWWSFPSLDTFFAPLLKLFPNFSDIGPRIKVDDDNFRIIVNAKGYKKDDLKVSVKNDFIFIQGEHESNAESNDHFATQFFNTYSLPENASASDVTAVLHPDGYLEIVAPLKGSGDTARPTTKVEIPITEDSEPYRKTEVESTDKPTTVEIIAPEIDEIAPEGDITKGDATTNQPTTFAEADNDRREPTTVSDREEVTEKDNSIPHGVDASEANELNEVQP